MRSSNVFIVSLALLALPVCAQTMDDDFAKSVKQWTTKPEFSSPLVDHLPKVSGIPSPKDVLGYHVGAPNKLTAYPKLLSYYRALAAASKRVRIVDTGKTDEGRDCVVVMISNEANIRNLDRTREGLAKLADPRNTSEAEARKIIAGIRPIYHLMGGLHSTETGPPEMLMELAYRLVTEDSDLIRKIRDNVIVSITPAAEPDGRDRVVDWYYAYGIEQKTEDERLPGPPYWGKYVFHDNNRDINYSQVTNRNLLRWYLQWHPPIMHDLHESVAFLYTFSGQSPQNPTLDPIIYSEMPWFSNFEMNQMTRYGMPGVWTHGFVDMWSPGYLGFMSSNHNGLLRMYETFGNGGANTMRRRITVEGAGGGGGGGGGRGATSREWYRPLPPYADVEWSMRNNTNYMQTGVLSALELTSSFPATVLDNFYRKSRNSIESGKKDAPYGFVIPAGQDLTRVAFAVNTLRLQGIEVGRSTAEMQLKEGKFGEGSFVIKRDQPYGRLAKILLEKQSFPDANLRTYDDTGWTMGLMARIEVREIADAAVLKVATQTVEKLEPRGKLTGGPARAAYVVAHNGSNALITLRHRLKDVAFEAVEQTFQADGVSFPAGSFLISSSTADAALHKRVQQAVEDLGLQAAALEKLPEGKRHAVPLPRLAVFSTWGNTQEVGWVRHALDQFEVPFDLIYKERIRAGKLRDSYDVIVMPHQGRTAKGLVFDIDSRGKKLAFKSPYGESEDISGGMGLPGVLEIDQFVKAGGTLITMGAASAFPVEFGVASRVEASRPTAQFYAPGPIVEADILQAAHPIFYGYNAKTASVRYANGPLLNVQTRDKSMVLMQFKGTDSAVLSGLMKNPAETRNRAAIVDIPSGTGRVILFATNPCYRWQNYGEFNMLFNAILHRK
ncbi:MAG: hypothetical protein HYZ37_02825 [Candidatus Solibacter usitatus]|nr:hypothetical protein [Candidatus Solibacter usitatus]